MASDEIPEAGRSHPHMHAILRLPDSETLRARPNVLASKLRQEWACNKTSPLILLWGAEPSVEEAVEVVVEVVEVQPNGHGHHPKKYQVRGVPPTILPSTHALGNEKPRRNE